MPKSGQDQSFHCGKSVTSKSDTNVFFLSPEMMDLSITAKFLMIQFFHTVDLYATGLPVLKVSD